MQKSEKLNSDKYDWRLSIIFIIFLFTSVPSRSEKANYIISEAFTSPFTLESGNYVVAGVFQYFENAVRYSDYLYSKGFETKYGYYAAKGYYYVYLKNYPSFDIAREACLKLRKNKEFREAWIFSIIDQYNYQENNLSAKRPQSSGGTLENSYAPQDKPNQREVAPVVFTEPQSKSEGKKAKYYFYFNSFDARNHAPIDAKIEIIDPEKLQQIATLDANMTNELEVTAADNYSLMLISQKFGYRKVEHVVDLNNIVGSSPDITRKGDTVYVDFELARLKAGDVATMYNVYFYNNSAVMKPESKYEVNQLLAMLQENENYKIMLHGHTNGNSFGPIIKLKDDANFFALSKDNKESKGSAKELSKERAHTIYRYLLSQGITKDRMKAVGWGGKHMLYGATDPNARLNVRVEVEILAD